MSGAPAASATQLSENIGDVLASIRRMIAQDPEASATSPGDMPLMTRSTPADVLRLGAATAVVSVSERTDPAPAPAVRSDSPSVGETATNSLQAEGPRAEALRWANASPAGPIAASAAPWAALRQSDLGDSPVDVDSSGESAMEPSLTDTGTRATSAMIATTVSDATASGAYGPPSPAAVCLDLETYYAAPSQTPEPVVISSQPEAASSANNPSEAPMSTLSLAPAPQDLTSVNQGPALQEDAGASIFSSMIREVIRQELHGEGMSRDLRSMILREVASALTREVVQVRPR